MRAASWSLTPETSPAIGFLADMAIMVIITATTAPVASTMEIFWFNPIFSQVSLNFSSNPVNFSFII